MNNYYEDNKYVLFFAVSRAFTNEIIGRGIQKWELEHVENILIAYDKEIKTAKKLIEQNERYRELPIDEKIELATWIVEYLYNQKEEEQDKKVVFRYLV